MPKRILFANNYYHVFNRGNRKHKIYFKQRDYHHFVRLMFKLSREYSFSIYSYCLMPNHYHILVNIGSKPEEFPKYMHRFMTAYSKYINKKYNLVGRLFQDRYRTKFVTREKGLKMVSEYIRRNPIEAGLVTKIECYKWYGDLSLGREYTDIEEEI